MNKVVQYNKLCCYNVIELSTGKSKKKLIKDLY